MGMLKEADTRVLGREEQRGISSERAEIAAVVVVFVFATALRRAWYEM